MFGGRWLDRLQSKVRTLSQRRRATTELSAELEFHVEQQTQENMAAGMEATEARLAAVRTFGNLTLLKEQAQETWGWSWSERIVADLRYAFRRLYKAPGFAVTVILTLALGIGANLAVFQLLHGVLFARLPVSKSNQLYSLRAVKSPFDGEWIFSYGAYQRLREATGDSAPVIARSGFGGGVLQASNGLSEQTSFQLVSANFFDALGLAPSAGRLFRASDDSLGQLEVPVILRYAYAKEKFASQGSVVGMRAVLNRVPIVVVGVAPDQFAGVVQGAAPDLWLPLSAQSLGQFRTAFDSLGPGYNFDVGASYRNQDGIFWLWVLAEVPDAGKVSAAARWTAALQPDIRMVAEATRDSKERERILTTSVDMVPVPGGEGTLSTLYVRPLSLLMGMAAMVFLVGCLNLANLQLARLSTRQREITTRIALGASRWRVLRQLLIEDLLLAVVGSLAALGTCTALSTLLLHWASGQRRPIPLILHIGLMESAVGASLLCVALVGFSLIPAWKMTRGNTGAALRSSLGNVGARGRRGRSWSSLMLAGQVSLSLFLLSMATLFTQTLLNLGRLDAGIDREHLLTVRLDLVSGGLDKQDTAALNERILDGLRSLPDVRGAAMQMCRVPGCGWNTVIHVKGRPELAEAQLHGEENHVSRDFFQTLGIPLLSGRVFNTNDQRTSQRVAILNHSFARKLFGDQSPVGHYIGYKPAPDDHAFLIVGEVGDAHVDGLRRSVPPVVYLSLEQGKASAGSIEIRAAGSPSSIAADVRQRLRSVDPNLPISEIVSLNEDFENGISTEKLLAKLTAIFAGLVLTLAAIGFYGLLSFHVARRTSEIGVRMALGASRSQVQRLFLRHTLRILVLGLIPGILMAVIVGRSARTLLYGIRETDPWSLLLSISVLLSVGLAATFIPARRAASLDPVKALRTE